MPSHSRSARRIALLGALALALAGWGATAANASHSVTSLISTGPSGGNGPFKACPIKPCGIGISKTGTRVFFESRERLVSSDTDASIDVYERSGGTTTLLSTGPSGGNGDYFAQFVYSSDDGSRVFFWTQEKLVSGDTDDYFDVYERSSGTTTLLSIGPGGGNGAYAGKFAGANSDGTHVFFRTQEPLTAGDTDDEWDLYERSSSSTALVSTGPNGGNGRHPARFAGTSADGSRVFFTTRESLVAGDSDSNCYYLRPCEDIYERSGGTTTLVSTGPSGGNGSKDAGFVGASDDGTRVFFYTQESLVTADTDTKYDLYERSSGTTTLVSTGPNDQHTWDVCLPPTCLVRISADGARVFFMTHESLVAGDTGYLDLYERSFGTTKLVSTGPFGGNGPFHVWSFRLEISSDGTHVFFVTPEKLVMSDTDSTNDVYERSGGTTTTLVSTGPTATTGADAVVVGVSEDGARALLRDHREARPGRHRHPVRTSTSASPAPRP